MQKRRIAVLILSMTVLLSSIEVSAKKTRLETEITGTFKPLIINVTIPSRVAIKETKEGKFGSSQASIRSNTNAPLVFTCTDVEDAPVSIILNLGGSAVKTSSIESKSSLGVSATRDGEPSKNIDNLEIATQWHISLR